MERLRYELTTLFQNRKMHVSLIQRDDYTLIVSNCSVVLFAEMDYVSTKVRGVEITVEDSNTSSSGFIVIFTIYPKLSYWKCSLFMQYILVFFLSLSSVVCTCDDYKNLFGIEHQINIV